MSEEIVIEIHKFQVHSEESAQQTMIDVDDEEIQPTTTLKSESSMKNYSDTVSLPQTIVHHVEATARLLSPSPSVSAADLASMETDAIVEKAIVDEMTIYQEDEETFSESVCEQKIEFETRAEV